MPRHNDVDGSRRKWMNENDTVEHLRDELKRVTDERDRLRKTVLQLMAEQMPLQSEEEFRKEIEEIRRNPVSMEELLEEVRSRLGLAEPVA
jgi:uncharacterized membrane protein YheB (UPF0754 family)